MVSEDNIIALGGFTSDLLVSVQGIMLAQMPEFNISRNRNLPVSEFIFNKRLRPWGYLIIHYHRRAGFIGRDHFKMLPSPLHAILDFSMTEGNQRTIKLEDCNRQHLGDGGEE